MKLPRIERGGFAVNFALLSLTTTKFERVFPHRSNEQARLVVRSYRSNLMCTHFEKSVKRQVCYERQ